MSFIVRNLVVLLNESNLIQRVNGKASLWKQRLVMPFTRLLEIGLRVIVKRFTRQFATVRDPTPESIRNIAWLNSDETGAFAKLIKQKLEKQRISKSLEPFCRATALHHGGYRINLLIPDGRLMKDVSLLNMSKFSHNKGSFPIKYTYTMCFLGFKESIFSRVLATL